MTSTEKNKIDLLNSIDLLNHYLSEFEKGNLTLYIPMSVELRKLLCEKDPSPLITRVLPDFKLYKLHSTSIFEKTPSLLDGLQHIMPGRLIVCEGKTPILTLLFSEDRELMRVDEWVNQFFFKEGITIYEFIRSVADKEGAHADPKDDANLKYCKNFSYGNLPSRILGIYSIARFVYDLIQEEYVTKI